MVRIITDSTCDLSKSRQVELGVEVAPLSVHFGAETFRDGVDLTNGDFYARLRPGGGPATTSQVNPRILPPASGPAERRETRWWGFLSPPCSPAPVSPPALPGIWWRIRISLWWTRGRSPSAGTAVERARFCGTRASPRRDRVRSGATLREAAVLRRGGDPQISQNGGRISAATAVVGGMLGITPILNIRDGVVEAAGKSRGRKGAYQWMEERIKKEPVDTALRWPLDTPTLRPLWRSARSTSGRVSLG